MIKTKTGLLTAVILGLLLSVPSFSLNLKKMGKKIVDKAAEGGGGAKVETLPAAAKTPDKDIENFKVTSQNSKTVLKVYVKYMEHMEIIHKPGLQIKIYPGGHSAPYARMLVYSLIFANPGKTSIPMMFNDKESKWESQDKKEYAKTFLTFDSKLPSTPKARLELLVKGMAKPLVKEYKLPFEIIDFKNAAPEVMQLPKGPQDIGCRGRGDECLDHFKVRELDRDKEITIRPIQRMCGNAGNKQPCVQVYVSLGGRNVLATHTVGLSEKRKAMAKNNVYQLADGSDFSGEGSWVSKDGKSWVKQYLVLGGVKPKIRVEVKLKTYGNPLVKEYELPFSI
jgi:hypothetical protein